MNLSKFLIMLIGIALIGYWLFADSSDESSSDPEPILSPAFVESISGFRAEFSGGSYEVLSIETKLVPEEQLALRTSLPAKRWVLFFPPGAPVKQELIAEMLTTLAELVPLNTYEDEEVPSESIDMGLIPPEMQLTLMAKKEQKVLFFGKQHPLTKRRYFQIDGESAVHLIDESVFNLFRQSALGLRIDSPLPIKINDVSFVSVETKGGKKFELFNNGGTWSALGGESDTVDSAKIPEYLAPLFGPIVTEYLDGPFSPEEKAALVKPDYLVRIRLDREPVQGESPEVSEVDEVEGSKSMSGDLPPTSVAFVVSARKGSSSTGFGSEVNQGAPGELLYFLRLQGSPWAYVVKRSKLGILQVNLEDLQASSIFAGTSCKTMQISRLRMSGEDKLPKIDPNSKKQLIESLCSLDVLSFIGPEDVRDYGLSGTLKPDLIEIGGILGGDPFTISIGEAVKAGADSQEDILVPHLSTFKIGDGKKREAVISGAWLKSVFELLGNKAQKD